MPSIEKAFKEGKVIDFSNLKISLNKGSELAELQKIAGTDSGRKLKIGEKYGSKISVQDKEINLSTTVKHVDMLKGKEVGLSVKSTLISA